MPLRDYFRPPVSARSSWEGFHGGWPMAMVQRLTPLLPDNFTAEPRVHLGSYFEIDVYGYEDDEPKQAWVSSKGESGGVATAAAAPPDPRSRSMPISTSSMNMKFWCTIKVAAGTWSPPWRL